MVKKQTMCVFFSQLILSDKNLICKHILLNFLKRDSYNKKPFIKITDAKYYARYKKFLFCINSKKYFGVIFYYVWYSRFFDKKKII